MWNLFSQLTLVLKVLKASPQEITEEYMAFLERFVVIIYNRKAALRKQTRRNKSSFQRGQEAWTVSLPLDRDLSNTSKEQCSKEATYGAKPSFCQPVLPSPSAWGWRQLNNYWSPFWTANSFDVDAEPHVENHASA